jgi:exosortase A-associated hydrolase 2
MPAREAWYEPLHPGPLGERFCVRHQACGQIRGLVLYVHPFSEELNRTRRMAALQSQRLAAAGYEVWQLDLFGCGDSQGDFGAASWALWLDDVRAAVRQLQARATDQSPVWLWGLRLGCLLAAQAAQGLVGPLNFLFWQPLLTGQAQLQMLLRLVSAGELLARQGPGEAAALRQRLSQGQPTEISGYELSTEMLQGLQQARLRPPEGVPLGRTVWLEVTSANALASVSPVVIQACQAWIEAGSALHYQQVVGPAFWQLAECDDATELLNATVDALRGPPAAAPS